MNPKSRRAALHAIAAVAVLASLNALAHSYIGLYGWATTHGLTGWQAATWPAEIDVFLIIGELALYIAYLDLWPIRHKIWPWATAIIGLAISVAGNVGYVRPGAAGSIDANRMTAATSPLAAFAGLAIALLVLKLTRPSTSSVPVRAPEPATEAVTATALLLLASAASRGSQPAPHAVRLARPMPLRRVAARTAEAHMPNEDDRAAVSRIAADAPDVAHDARATESLQRPLLDDAQAILATANDRGTRLTQQGLAKELRHRGHKVPNAKLKHISTAIGLTTGPQRGSARSPAASPNSGIGRVAELSGRAGQMAPGRTVSTDRTNSFVQLTHTSERHPFDLDAETSPKLPFRHNWLIRTRDAG